MADTTIIFEESLENGTALLESGTSEVTTYIARPSVTEEELRRLEPPDSAPEPKTRHFERGNSSSVRALSQRALSEWRQDAKTETRVWIVLFVCGAVSVLYAVYSFFVRG